MGSSGACEMSVFHALVAGNGTKPLRLALFPVVIWVQAEVDPAASMVRLRFADADSAMGWVESVTVIVTGAVPRSACVGFPVIVPDVALMVKPLGNPLAVNA